MVRKETYTLMSCWNEKLLDVRFVIINILVFSTFVKCSLKKLQLMLVWWSRVLPQPNKSHGLCADICIIKICFFVFHLSYRVRIHIDNVCDLHHNILKTIWLKLVATWKGLITFEAPKKQIQTREINNKCRAFSCVVNWLRLLCCEYV